MSRLKKPLVAEREEKDRIIFPERNLVQMWSESLLKDGYTVHAGYWDLREELGLTASKSALPRLYKWKSARASIPESSQFLMRIRVLADALKEEGITEKQLSSEAMYRVLLKITAPTRITGSGKGAPTIPISRLPEDLREAYLAYRERR